MYKKYFCFFCILLGLASCGGDDDELAEAGDGVDSLAPFAGNWRMEQCDEGFASLLNITEDTMFVTVNYYSSTSNCDGDPVQTAVSELSVIGGGAVTTEEGVAAQRITFVRQGVGSIQILFYIAADSLYLGWPDAENEAPVVLDFERPYALQQ